MLFCITTKPRIRRNFWLSLAAALAVLAAWYGNFTTESPPFQMDFTTELPQIQMDIENNSSTILEYIRSPLQRRTLPSFVNGGIVIFFHIAKTGGTTIRESIPRMDGGIECRQVQAEGQLLKFTNKIEGHLTRNTTAAGNRKILFVEFHPGVRHTLSGLPRLSSRLQRWRQLAHRHNTSFFAFTILREPVSFHISYFRFFFRPGCRWNWCEKPNYELTAENLLQTAVPNHQCLWLARDRQLSRNIPVDASECQQLYKTLLTNLDWVGTTQDIKTKTLPLLWHMLVGNHTASQSMPPQNVHSGGNLTKDKLDPSVLSKLQSLSPFDQEMYESVQRYYTLGMWSNLPTKSTILE